MTFARILGITVATSVIVFLGLTFLLPRHHEEKAQSAAITPDQVFGSAATPPAQGETPAATPAEPSNPAASDATPAATPAPAESASTASAPSAPDTSSAPAPSSAPQGLTDEEARKIAEDVGRKVATRVVEEKSAASAPAPAAPSSDSSSTTLTESDVRRIAAEEARRVYAESGRSSGESRKSRSKLAPEAPAESSVAAAEPAPSAEGPTTTPTTKPASSEESMSKPSRVKTKKAKDMPGDLPASDAISAWWPVTGKQPADHLNLVYAGESASEKAAVLLFDNPVDGASAGSHLQLFSADGKEVTGSWESSSSNPRMLTFKGLSPGRYTVVLAPELADASGKTLGTGLHGPVYVH